MHALPLFAVVLAASSCRSERDSLPADAPPSATPIAPAAVAAHVATPFISCHAQASESSRIVLQRTGCYGFYPSYTVEIRPDGNVTYTGTSYVRVHGEAHWRIPKAEADALFDRARCAAPESWRPGYLRGITHSPSAVVTVDLDSLGHPVVVNDYPPCHKEDDPAPDALCELEKAIDAATGAESYVACAPEDGGPGFCPP